MVVICQFLERQVSLLLFWEIIGWYLFRENFHWSESNLDEITRCPHPHNLMHPHNLIIQCKGDDTDCLDILPCFLLQWQLMQKDIDAILTCIAWDQDPCLAQGASEKKDKHKHVKVIAKVTERRSRKKKLDLFWFSPQWSPWKKLQWPT